jgi:phage terminase large subunit
MYSLTSATKKLLQLNKRIRGVSGGTSAGKTISILTILINYAQTHTNEIVSVVSETLPHLKRGAMRDFLNIMNGHNYFKDDRWNKSDFIYTFETGTIMEFFSADQYEKVRGARRDVLFINEANGIGYETFTQMEVRTKRIVWLDWNPVAEFFFYTEILPHFDCDFITLNYKDNEALDPAVVQALEAHRFNTGWWRVYGEGLLGEAEGRIYKGWELVDEVPPGATLEGYGLDFGYTNDPTAIVARYKYNDYVVLHEIMYKQGLSNREIGEIILNSPRALVIADSAEPKSIDELKSLGISIIPTIKGPGSVLQGIQYVQDQKIMVTKSSVNLIKEYHNYLWLTDRDGKIINEPTQIWNHCMDAVRYAMSASFVKDKPPAYNPPNREKIIGAGMPTEWGGVVGY